ncbi:ECF transporter S component [Alicyclobacillus dauci]|uniref:ECF transporter S component n=1 Tax=Alicyclobacillus dauci TaxID=1475485 RepID=A0ABY6YZ09_9BACL|nr:ECF transporter S component [Alicyclobacillus dauci]WAH35873.1 ECF transporter S component [Alicyclobacillus dauci]
MDSPKHTQSMKTGSLTASATQSQSRQRTRWLVITAVLAAISIVLSLTPLGLIPVPTPAGSATILQVPAILAAVLAGPFAGGIVGAVFGVVSMLHSSGVPWFTNPLVSVVPRILIGVISYFVYASLIRGAGRARGTFALIVTGFIGSVVNTVLVLGAVYIFFPVKLGSLVTVALVQGLPEAVVSAILTTAIAAAYLGITRQGRKSRIS